MAPGAQNEVEGNLQVDAPGKTNPERATQPPKVPNMNCGCTEHWVHVSCTDDCVNCGYRKIETRGETVQRLQVLERDAAAVMADLRQQVATKQARQLSADLELEAPPPLVAELWQWWAELARTEADQVIAKAIEYGSRDLVEIGLDLARCMDRKVTDQEAAELGVYFYLRGKLARWTEAVVRGEQPSDDTLKDIGVYVRMAQRIRSHGGWPGVGE